MNRLFPFAVLFSIPLLASSCFIDTDDNDADPEECRTECEDTFAGCSVDCDEADEACRVDCDSERTSCFTDCD